MGPIRLLLVDDDERYARTLEVFLKTQPEFAVVGTRERARDAIADYAILQPDVVVIDARMPETDGIEATWAIITENPGARVVVLSADEDSGTRERALRAGAVEFVSKRDVARDLPAAIRRAAEGQQKADAARSREPSAADSAGEARRAVAISQEEASAPPAPPCEIAFTVTVSIRGWGVVDCDSGAFCSEHVVRAAHARPATRKS